MSDWKGIVFFTSLARSFCKTCGALPGDRYATRDLNC